MKLSDGEKLVALMLADLMENLEVDGEIDPGFVKKAIYGDDAWALRWKYGGAFHNDGPSDEIVDETGKIMTMCRVVENSIAQLSESERAEIPEEDHTVFVGFDGNHEPHYGVATMLVENLDRFTEWRERDLNSHHNTLDKYRAMVRAYDRMDMPIRGVYGLNDIRTILDADRFA